MRQHLDCAGYTSRLFRVCQPASMKLPHQGRPGYRPPQSTRRPPFYRKPRFCYFKKSHGPCKWRFYMWWYNAETNKCEQFVYGGCRGNRNRFLSCFECLVTCSGNPRMKNRCIRLQNRYG